MITAIIGRKLEMTQVFADDGTVYPVTLVQAGPCTITQVKTHGKDGYAALQIGFGTKKPKNVNRPLKGHLDKVGKGYFEVLREIAAENPAEHNPGDQVLAEIFEIGDRVDIIGKSKGKGFAGTIKRWRFQRGPGRPWLQERSRARFDRYGDLPGPCHQGQEIARTDGNKRNDRLEP